MRGYTLIAERRLGSFHLMTLKERTLRNDGNGVIIPFVVVHLSNWVNVVVITADGQMVMVEQGRVGIDAPTIEICGGTIEPGEDPRAAAEREMLEETGYRPGRMISLGQAAVNPAIQDNWCHFFLALDSVRVAELSLDPGEDITVRLMDIAAVRKAVDDGTIVHSLGLLGIMKAFRELDLTRASVNG